MFNIIAIDGGGSRGLIAASILEQLSRQCPNLFKKTDLIAGTSTGAIIAVGIALEKEPAEMVKLYKDKTATIFRDNLFDDIRDFGKALGAAYSSDGLEEVLKDFVGAEKIMRELKKKVLIPTFDLAFPDPKKMKHGKGNEGGNWKPKFFHNFEVEDARDNDCKELIYKVLMRSSAAPTYFPTYDGYIDGGVVANNPSMAALAQALDARTCNQQLKDINILSIGTGQSRAHIETVNGEKDWGYVRWAAHLPSILIDGVMGVADYQCRQLLGEGQYHRINLDLGRKISLDSTNVEELADIAASDDAKIAIDAGVDWLAKSSWFPKG